MFSTVVCIGCVVLRPLLPAETMLIYQAIHRAYLMYAGPETKIELFAMIDLVKQTNYN